MFCLCLFNDLISLSIGYRMFQQSSLRQQEGRCVAAGRHHASVTFKDNEPVAESTADRSNLRVHLSSLSGGVGWEGRDD